MMCRTEAYNRVDKISLNNPLIVSPEKIKKPFAYATAFKQPKDRAQDDMHMEAQDRHIGGSYVPKKRTIQSSNPGLNQLQSTMGGVL